MQDIVKQFGVNAALTMAGAASIILLLYKDIYKQSSVAFYSTLLTSILLIAIGLSKKFSATSKQYDVKKEDDHISIRLKGGESNSSEVKIVCGKIENRKYGGNSIVALPVNSTFQDECIKNEKSSTGAYMKAYLGEINDVSYSAITGKFNNIPNAIGHVISFLNFESKGDNVLFVAVTRNDSGTGIRTNPISISFASQEMIRCTKQNGNEKISELFCPIFGSGKGGEPTSSALTAMINGVFAGFKTWGVNNFIVTIIAYPNGNKTLDLIYKQIRGL